MLKLVDIYRDNNKYNNSYLKVCQIHHKISNSKVQTINKLLKFLGLLT